MTMVGMAREAYRIMNSVKVTKAEEVDEITEL